MRVRDAGGLRASRRQRHRGHGSHRFATRRAFSAPRRQRSNSRMNKLTCDAVWLSHRACRELFIASSNVTRSTALPDHSLFALARVTHLAAACLPTDIPFYLCLRIGCAILHFRTETRTCLSCDAPTPAPNAADGIAHEPR